MDFNAETYEPYQDPYAEPWERSYAMWIHLGSLIAFAAVVLPSAGVGFFVPALVALVLWLIRRHDSPFIDDHGREALNFQISLLILFIPAIVVGVLLCGVGVLVTLPGWAVLGIVGGAFAASAANRGRYYRYPMCVRLLG